MKKKQQPGKLKLGKIKIATLSPAQQNMLQGGQLLTSAPRCPTRQLCPSMEVNCESIIIACIP
ncbi:hypothetical protein CLV51_110105 [Chitinophaga niastensis]|uniref:Uncharacterized protein n=1 Tax=Chitinophaga niastensis TaxID=536980 RepID=A0A2P8H9J6_CHINA|nr:class I lanthipeptide [Chitinophaga niastensis]PSL42888.1 hypothetical protein CLV51_110105 [Chitinophaga niastensis]